jgi:hypothetical protein
LKDMDLHLENKRNPLKLIVKIVKSNEQHEIIEQATQALKNLSKNKTVVDMLMNDATFDFIAMFKKRFAYGTSLTK